MKKRIANYGYCLALLCAMASCSATKEQPQTEDQAGEDKFADHIRKTEALTPQEQQAAFKLPPGFEIQLFASEPLIGKPINMAFDARGRLWVSQSYEYPFASSGVGKDKISILEDTDGDGTADVITDFADSLNIPIGVMPVQGGALAYSIPNVYFLADHDGDDKVDERRVVLSGFEYKDTHGMINNFFRGLDGWVHASHGFANTSQVTTRRGKVLKMHSGNTFRFREDGSDVQFTTTGRVNPFGYAYDEMGYLYSVDCHTSPIYQLIRGADYPHFGKKPTGIGFGPSSAIKNQRGATALAGLQYYIAQHFPEQYQNSFYYGDVVKCKVYRSTMEKKGTTAYITQEEDFISTDDPWFRPVDVKIGPDGALYIADFYNRIIGHYEVPLDHPGRDRERGRIWRIVYTGKESTAKPEHTDWTKAGLEELVSNLGHTNLSLRTLIADQIYSRFGQQAVPLLKSTLRNGSSIPQRVQALWLLYRLQALEDSELGQMLNQSSDTMKVHALRVMFEYTSVDEALLRQTRKFVERKQPDLVRAAAMVLSKNPSPEQLTILLEAQQKVLEEDTHLVYVFRQTLRDHLYNDDIFNYALNRTWSQPHTESLVDIALGIDSPLAAQCILNYVESGADISDNYLKRLAEHAIQFLSVDKIPRLVEIAKKRTAADMDNQFRLYQVMRGGLSRQKRNEPRAMRSWALGLVDRFIGTREAIANYWQPEALEKAVYRHNPWQITTLEGGQAVLASGNVEHEKTMSVLRSPVFSIPEQLAFSLFGHKGKDDDPTTHTNKVELVLADTDEVVHLQAIDAEGFNKKIVWNNPETKGKKGYLRLTDGSAAQGRYVAISQPTPAVVNLPSVSPSAISDRQVFAAHVIKNFRANHKANQLTTLLKQPGLDYPVKVAVLDALLELDNRYLTMAQEILADDNTRPHLIRPVVELVARTQSPKAIGILREALQGKPYSVQRSVAEAMAQSVQGIGQLLLAVAKVEVVPRVLLENKVKEYLTATASDEQKERYASVIANVKKPEEAVQKMIDERMSKFVLRAESAARGSEVFVQNCAPCHQMGGKGGLIGPQLDGIGNWGAHALTEKILDPNRNISKAFINYNIKLKDGSFKTGLLRREEGALVVFANAAGQEFSIPKAQIAEQKPTATTLMSDQFGESIPEDDFYALLNYLLTQR